MSGAAPGPKPYPEGSGSLGPGRCSICGTPWVFNVARSLWVAVCGCHQENSRVTGVLVYTAMLTGLAFFLLVASMLYEAAL